MRVLIGAMNACGFVDEVEKGFTVDGANLIL
jgi:hypothetical protein